MKDLTKRVTFSMVAITLVVILLAFAYHDVFKWLLAFCIASLSSIAIWEYAQAAKAKSIKIPRYLLETGSFFIVMAFFISSVTGDYKEAPFIILFIFISLLFILHFKKCYGAMVDVAVGSFGFLYISLPMALMIHLVYLPPSIGMHAGRWWVIYLVVVTKITDVGAYFSGRILGRRKLASSISPNKTLEGAVGGLILSMLASIVFFYYFDAKLECQSCSMEMGLALGVILGIVGQVGDLSESLIKRDAKIKDSNTLPGLGGVLDMLDSLLFTTPIIFFYLNH